ncbi:MAG: FAD/NAD(P)-binding oxidoreductase [Lautropia sp.]|nr:FAD/NAD(P)-binding oxidoreductase [Lautropia sp.]
MKRRHLLSLPPALALASALPAASLSSDAQAARKAPAAGTGRSPFLPRKGKAPRILICGGGWGGMTAARYLKEGLPDADVILVERHPTFWSGPMSNKWLIDIVPTDFVNHDMQIPASRYGYTLVQAEVMQIERDKRLVQTSQGWLDYDYLILSGGIRDAWDAWFGDDQQTILHTRRNFSSAYLPNQEMLGLKRRVHAFKGGTLVMTLPPPPHRCPPSPYERACLIAAHIKRNKIPGKVVILDPKPRIAPISMGYQQAFEELYPDIIQHVPNAGVLDVDPYNKRMKTKAGDFDFDEAILMPPHQAAEMVWRAGLIGTDDKGKPTGWSDIHPRLFHAKADDRVYLVGDCMGFISRQFGHYPKSAHVANVIGKIVARNLTQRIKGEEVTPILPNNLCYMMVNTEPREAISVLFDYELDANGQVIQNQVDVDVRSPDLVKEDFEWIGTRFGEFLAP